MKMQKLSGNKHLPTDCPACGDELKVSRLHCETCDTAVEGKFELPVLCRLSAEEQLLATRFIMASGSLKDLAREYGISYPTMRNRLDELISRIDQFLASEGK